LSSSHNHCCLHFLTLGQRRIIHFITHTQEVVSTVHFNNSLALPNPLTSPSFIFHSTSIIRHPIHSTLLLALLKNRKLRKVVDRQFVYFYTSWLQPRQDRGNNSTGDM